MKIKLLFTMERTLRNHLRKNNGKTFKFLTLLFLFSFGIFFGQYQKIDYKFETLIRESKIANPTAEKLSNLAKLLELDQFLVMTANGAQTMYSCKVFTNNPKELKDNGILIQSTLPKFVTALATIEDLEKMVKMKDVISITAPVFSKLTNDVSRMQSGANLLQNGALNNTNYNGEGVLVGIYDSGIDWKHPDFRDINDPTKSRIISIWDQTLTPVGAEIPPAGFATGVEYTTVHINDELDGTPSHFIRQKDINGHGTHVAATAVGNGAVFSDRRHKGFAPNAGIVIVKGSDENYSDISMVNAFSYFQNVATALNKPIVVNMSIGGQASAHDGTAPHEMAVDNFTTSGPGRVAVIAAGNEYGKSMHKKTDIEPNHVGTFNFVAASSTTESVVFVYFMYGNNDNNVVARLTTPDGNEYISPPSTTIFHSILNGKFTAEVHNFVSAENNKRMIQMIITRNPGATEDIQGIYTIDLLNEGTSPTIIHGYKLAGAEATLIDGDNEFNVGTPGNAATAITVASYTGRLSWYKSNAPQSPFNSVDQAENITNFSNQGPRADGFLKPDIAASGDKVISAMSSDAMLDPSHPFNVDGTFYRTMQGTSMASPGVAGAVALLLQANPNLTAAEVKTRLTENARQDAATYSVPNTRWGFGKLDIYEAVADEIGCQTSESETIAYDEQYYFGNEDTNLTSDNKIFAVKYTPAITGKLGSVNFFTGIDEPGNIPITIAIRTVGNDGKPGQILASKTFNSLLNDVQRNTWNSVDFSQFGIPITIGQDFYVTIDASTGTMAIKSDAFQIDHRSSYSADHGLTWIAFPEDFRIRAMVYEDKPQIKKLATQNEAVTFAVVAGKNYANTNCDFIAMVEKNAGNTITGNITAKVWVTNADATHVARRYEITPATDPENASGKVTLYFNQAEFDAYNVINSVKLPTSPTDEAGKANLLVDKFAGTSSDNSGTFGSYTSGYVTLTPAVENVNWNPTYKYWEVTLETTGFSGFFLRTSSSMLATANVKNELISVYPNPVKDVLNISLNAQKGSVKIFDLSGKVVQTNEINKAGIVDVSKLSKGIYIVEITTNGNTKVTKKIIKE